MASSLYITGLAHQYPQHVVRQNQFEEMVEKLCPNGTSTPGIKKLLSVNQKTGIAARPFVSDFLDATKDHSHAPSIDELSRIFRKSGVGLTVKACKKALIEARLSASDITHVVAVTCTDTGNPGYDLLVSQELQLPSHVDRVLLHGVGCAGGLSALRQAANMASGASQRNRPARILVFACELCSLYAQSELQMACQDSGEVRIAPALFSDAAAAVVVCNELGLNGTETPIYELRDWKNAVLPETLQHMEFVVDTKGYKLTLTKEVPKAAVGAITPMFEQLQASLADLDARGVPTSLKPNQVDWAMHPGGASILHGAQHALGLSENQLRASYEVYRAHGNSSSPTVLIVMDELRQMGAGRDKVVATSFGPGLSIEMITMKRCRGASGKAIRSNTAMQKAYKTSFLSISKFSKGIAGMVFRITSRFRRYTKSG